MVRTCTCHTCQTKAVWALAIIVAAGLAVHDAEAELLVVYAVNRHGARNFLPKTSLLVDVDANGGPTLLPEGQRQCYNAGVSPCVASRLQPRTVAALLVWGMHTNCCAWSGISCRGGVAAAVTER